MSKNLGYRGYINSKKIRDGFIPQRVQNLVIKDYAEKRNFFLKLSATEYKNSKYLHLENLLKNLKSIDGIICYSLFMLPVNKNERIKIYSKILKSKKSIHFALEEINISEKKDIKLVENIIKISENTK
tara:strand:+ start:97 stop:480 length:384 start_codon:yes stop_codon:yes gene_type:complete